MSKKVIILGTAHGVNVAGKRSPDGAFREYKFSREVVKALQAQLKEEGYTVVVDIEGDIVPAKQATELKDRVQIVNHYCTLYGASNCIYVSVHVNAFGSDEKWHDKRGWSIYTSPGNTKADLLATCIWKAADRLIPHDNRTAIRADYGDGDPDFEANLYVLKYTHCPAVLTENLFQDNKEDVAYLMSAVGKAAIVRLHKEGIMEFLKQR